MMRFGSFKELSELRGAHWFWMDDPDIDLQVPFQ